MFILCRYQCLRYIGTSDRLEDYPNAHAQYVNEITLPLYSKLSVDEAEYVAKELIHCVEILVDQKNTHRS